MNPSLIEIRMDSFVNRRKYVSHNDRTETVPLWRGGLSPTMIELGLILCGEGPLSPTTIELGLILFREGG